MQARIGNALLYASNAKAELDAERWQTANEFYEQSIALIDIIQADQLTLDLQYQRIRIINMGGIGKAYLELDGHVSQRLMELLKKTIIELDKIAIANWTAQEYFAMISCHERLAEGYRWLYQFNATFFHLQKSMHYMALAPEKNLDIINKFKFVCALAKDCFPWNTPEGSFFLMMNNIFTSVDTQEDYYRWFNYLLATRSTPLATKLLPSLLNLMTMLRDVYQYPEFENVALRKYLLVPENLARFNEEMVQVTKLVEASQGLQARIEESSTFGVGVGLVIADLRRQIGEQQQSIQALRALGYFNPRKHGREGSPEVGEEANQRSELGS